MEEPDGSKSFYFFDIDDNLLFLPTKLYLWNAETQKEQVVASGEFAAIQGELGRVGAWHAWSTRAETFRYFRDRAGVAPDDQSFVIDLLAACEGAGLWKGPSWDLLVHAADQQRPIALVTARGHAPTTIEAGLRTLVDRGLLPALPPVLGIYTVTNEHVRVQLGVTDPAMTVPSIKKLAIKNAVDVAMARYGAAPPHRFGMSDDDPTNVVLAISAMRDCKQKYPNARFFVINTNHDEFVKLEIFPMPHPRAACSADPRLLRDSKAPSSVATQPERGETRGGTASIYVSDMNRSVAFYTKALGLRLQTRLGEEWAEVDAGNGLIIGLHPARPPATVVPGTAGAINIELAVTKPLEDVVAAMTSRGVTFSGAIQNYENVRLATAADPDGTVIFLAQVLNSGVA